MKVKGPMFSLEASGTIGGVVTAAKWKGRPYFRTTSTPSNPRTAGQVSTRAMFKFLSQAWAGVPDLSKSSWDDLAAASNITQMNAYMKYDQRRWTQFTSPSQEYPAAETNAPGTATTLVTIPGVKQVTLTYHVNDGGGDNWGTLVFRSTTTGFTPGTTDLVGVGPAPEDDDTLFVDTPVAAGTYYYRLQTFSIDGTLGALTAQVSAVVT